MELENENMELFNIKNLSILKTKMCQKSDHVETVSAREQEPADQKNDKILLNWWNNYKFN